MSDHMGHSSGKPFELLPQQIHIWRAPLDLPEPQIQQLAQTLNPQEQQRADRYRFPHDRRHFIAARGWLRELLGRYLNHSPEQVQFCYGPHGKPGLDGFNLAFNLSHTQGIALYAIGLDGELGIDLEQVRPIEVLPLAERFFLPPEVADLQTLAPEAQLTRFFTYWTCKEAYLKATGQGLTGLSQAQILFDAHHRPQLWLPEQSVPFLQSWALAPGYQAALVATVPPLNICYWDLEPERILL